MQGVGTAFIRPSRDIVGYSLHSPVRLGKDIGIASRFAVLVQYPSGHPLVVCTYFLFLKNRFQDVDDGEILLQFSIVVRVQK